MLLKADLELKFRRFMKKNGRLLIIIVIIGVIIFSVNKILGSWNKTNKPTTTLKEDIAVLDSNVQFPKKVQSEMEQFIGKFVEYCNNKDYNKAYDMISDDCKENYFGEISVFKEYVKERFETKKQYAIQGYSIYNDKYIYNVKFFNDFLSSGITNDSYMFQEEKIVAQYVKNENNKKELVFSVGNYIESQDVKSVQENEYVKISVKKKIVKYGLEEYFIKITNRTENEITLQEGNDQNGICLNLGDDLRSNEIVDEINVAPYETVYVNAVFAKFYDNKRDSIAIDFNDIKVHDGSKNGTEFSMELGLN